MRSRRRLRLLMFAVTALVLTGATLAANELDAFRSAELDTVDARFSVRGTETAPDVAVVGIDTDTLTENGRFPFARGHYAPVLDALRRDGASVVAIDVQFTEPTDEENDNALIEAVDALDRVVLAATEVDARGRTNVFGGAAADFGARVGFSQLPNDPGAVLRRMPYDHRGVKAFAIEAAQLHTGRTVSRQALGDDTAWIDYAGPPGTIRTLSFLAVQRGDFPRGTFRGKVVVIGPTADSLQDVHPTSTASDERMSGAEIQANSVQTAVRAFPLQPAGGWLAVLLIVVAGLVGPLAALRFGPVRALLPALGAVALLLAGTQLAFQSGRITPLVGPLVSLGAGMVGALAVGLAVAAFERERVRDLFSRFVPEAVVYQVLANLDEDLRLGGESRIATVLFSDVRGFTTFAESRPPDVVIEALNRYLTAMSTVVLDHGGTLIAYMGDGIMAAFGAPLDQTDHADRALACAREMQGPALAEFNEWIRERGVADGFRIGVGINSGPVMSGNVGSEQRLEYTVIGDTTNTAARLEGMTKGTPHMVFVADSTRTMLTRETPDLFHVDDLPVRGKQATVSIWSIPVS